MVFYSYFLNFYLVPLFYPRIPSAKPYYIWSSCFLKFLWTLKVFQNFLIVQDLDSFEEKTG